VTLMLQTRVPDDVHEEVRSQLSEEELVKLTVAVRDDQRLEPHADQLSCDSSDTQSTRGLNVDEDLRSGHRAGRASHAAVVKAPCVSYREGSRIRPFAIGARGARHRAQVALPTP